MDDFSYDVERDGDAVTIRVRGEWDMDATFRVEQDLDAAIASAGQVTLDLSAVTFMDSTALGAFLNVRSRAKDRAVPLTVVPGPPNVQHLFEVAGIPATG